MVIHSVVSDIILMRFLDKPVSDKLGVTVAKAILFRIHVYMHAHTYMCPLNVCTVVMHVIVYSTSLCQVRTH